jgi:hypothetical protein
MESNTKANLSVVGFVMSYLVPRLRQLLTHNPRRVCQIYKNPQENPRLDLISHTGKDVGEILSRRLASAANRTTLRPCHAVKTKPCLVAFPRSSQTEPGASAPHSRSGAVIGAVIAAMDQQDPQGKASLHANRPFRVIRLNACRQDEGRTPEAGSPLPNRHLSGRAQRRFKQPSEIFEQLGHSHYPGKADACPLPVGKAKNASA